ncbi:MAG: LysR family transcriptional regulator [Peptococcaceae bacterium]|nr:LysR family transcriptional regulator [Peptococcaceae bacterium]MBQ2448569.1 LysR family transcriptional regulator [Peptococcaceae bacterium]MBQ5682462.1 LysR family transcriptional regulator [Peptococcaceae bacterium]MBQ5702462.1 LysR family transcriptional regulator [Peptococcaceae bacterium]
MNILSLKYAVTVARCGSISAAAEQLAMNQPNLSKAIKELESSLNMTIFQRTSTGVIPTTQGQEFLDSARHILLQIEELENRYKSEEHRKVAFSVSVPRASYITYAFADFANSLNSSGEFELNFMETNSMEAIQNISKKGYTMGIIRYRSEYDAYFQKMLQEKRMQSELLWEFEYQALMPVRNPLAGKQKVSLSDLVPLTEIIHGDWDVPFIPADEQEQILSIPNQKKKVYVYERGSQFDLLQGIPDSFMWVSPVPEQILKRYQLVQLGCSEMAGSPFRDVLISPQGHRFSSVEKGFIERVKDVRDAMNRLYGPLPWS